MDYLLILGGLVGLFFGGEGLLRGSVALARRFGLSDLLVSAVIVGFGTSMPELTVSVKAALANSPEIALGNVVGSNIANVLLILAVCVIIFPIHMKDKAVIRDALMVLIASVILCTFSFFGLLGFWEGLVMFLVLVGYIGWGYRQDRQRSKQKQAQIAEQVQEDTAGAKPIHPLLSVLYCIGGLGLLVLGADFLVRGATSIAREAGIPEAIIGLTLIAVGTSLPELATGTVAAVRKHGDVIIGNILGSNIFNILGILGITAMIKPVPMTGQIVSFDIWVMLAVAAALIPIILTDKLVSRREGVVMLLAYISYIAWLYSGMGV